MKRLLFVYVLGLCGAAPVWADAPLNAQTWRRNPGIIDAHRVYLQVHAALKAHRLKVKVRRFNCPLTQHTPTQSYPGLNVPLGYYPGSVMQIIDYPDRVREIALDVSGMPRFYYREGGSGDYLEREDYYYDALGTLRLVIVRAGLAYGPHIVRRIYYSAQGSKLWEDDKQTGGGAHSFGTSGPVVFPLDSFNAPDPCTYRSPQGGLDWRKLRRTAK